MQKQNLYGYFLTEIQKQNSNVFAFLKNGVKLEDKILDFDCAGLLLSKMKPAQYVYASAIATVMTNNS